MGAYLAVNALPDSYILVDGPDCSLYKAHFIFGRHDLRSTLLDINGWHRVCFTNVCAQSVTKDHNELIFRRLRKLDESEGPGIILLTALPGCSITGIDYEHLLRSVETILHKPAVAIPPASLLGDWLDGYAVTLRALARHMDLSGGNPKPENVALVGYFMDRNEGDHRGNLRELGRILQALSLNLVSVWLGGQPYEALRRVRDAGLILSLPYAREAAEEIARKTGARLVVAGLPFGFRATERWVRQVAEAEGRSREGEALLRAERRRVLESLEWIVPRLFLHSTVSYMGDPYLIDGFSEICEDLGLRLMDTVAMSRPERKEVLEREGGPTITYEPDAYHPVMQRIINRPPDIVVTNTNEIMRVVRWHRTPVVEIGFPSYFHHALADIPFLGFDGFLAFAERLADAYSSLRSTIMTLGPNNEAQQGWRDGPPPGLSTEQVEGSAVQATSGEALGSRPG